MTCTKRTRKRYKPFRCWDGEGHNFPDGSHRMTLLANSDGEYIENLDGLSSMECIRFLTQKRPPAYNVWFAFGYDVAQILRDLPMHGERGSLEHLWGAGHTWFENLYIRYLPHKFFTLRYNGVVFSSTDTFSFFQESFLKACKRWNIDASAIVKGKESRSVFAEWSAAQIRDYNFAELALLKRLLDALREALAAANLAPTSWHGPGAIASAWLTREGLRAHYAAAPDDMEPAIMHAYFGGRIDMSLVGEALANKSDIASAYPAALTDCISLVNIEWRLSKKPTKDDRHALYHVRWNCEPNTWYPLPWRNKVGQVLYPPSGEGWYWGVEILAAQAAYPNQIERIEAWYPTGEKVFPFKEPILRDYALRAEHKRAGRGAHIAFKLALNSLYGKLAQHVGGGPRGKPPWQSYIWAGYVTSYTRARIIDAMRVVGLENTLAVMTDGLFTREPIPAEPAALGAWEDEGESPVLFVAPGLYAVLHEDGAHIVKARGMPGMLNYGWILRAWGCNTGANCDGAESFAAHTSQFVGIGKALQSAQAPFAQFRDEKRELHNVTLEGTSKRIPAPKALVGDTWPEYPLIPRRRSENRISYPYERRVEYEPLEE